ncbi:MAG: hypothetical protein ACRC2T_08070 [Thermoguttaceae bacterium]
MENDPKNAENTPKEESWMTRRKIIQVSAVGALVAVSGLHVVYQRSKSKPALASTEITIEGPFKEYGYFRPKDLGREDINKLDSDFKLETLILDEGKYHDNVMISFTFSGDEDPNRKMKVFLTVYDKEGKVIGESQNTFADPRIVARESNGNQLLRSIKKVYMPSATLAVKLDKESRVKQIGRLDISTHNTNNI